MTDMLDDPAVMTPPQRRREIATITALPPPAPGLSGSQARSWGPKATIMVAPVGLSSRDRMPRISSCGPAGRGMIGVGWRRVTSSG